MNNKDLQNQFARKGRSYPASFIEQRITSYSVQLKSQDIRMWQRAINAAWSEINPDRRALQELFQNVAIDGHLEGVMEKRMNAIINRKVEFVPADQDETPENIREYITGTPWFRDLMKSMMNAIPYGYSLTELVPRNGMIDKVIDIDRRNVIPEWDALLWNQSVRTEGINYLEDPKYSRYLIFTGGKKSYGKLLTAAQYVIYKRGGFADWAQFIELFGMPIKVGRYDPYDDNMRRKMDEAIKNMGAAPHIVLPKGAEFELMQVNNTGTSTTQKDLIEVCNAEISKTFLGNTLTTEQGKNGARALGTVHQDVEESINTADAVEIEYKLNWELADKLREIGYPIPKGEFKLPQTRELPLEERIKIDKEIHDRMPLSEEYWIETYGVSPMKDAKLRVPKSMVPVDDPNTDEDDDQGGGEGLPAKKPGAATAAQTQTRIKALYADACDHCNTGITMAFGGEIFAKIWERLAKQLHGGERPLIDDELLQATADQLSTAITSHNEWDDENFTEQPLANKLVRNVQVFSGFKTYQQLQEATSLLVDDAGAVRPFSQFLTEILELNEQYNVRYLQAEYNHAVASSQMAIQWANTGANDILTYLTAKDERVRDAHRVLEGVTLPRRDSFWNTYYPPNGWGCRCLAPVTATGKPTPADEIITPDVPPMFRHNPGKTGVVFPDTHPYFDVQKRTATRIKSATTKALKK